MRPNADNAHTQTQYTAPKDNDTWLANIKKLTLVDKRGRNGDTEPIEGCFIIMYQST